MEEGEETEGGGELSVKFTSHKSEFMTNLQANINRALEICGGTAEAHAVVNITRNRSVRTNRLRTSIAHKQIDDHTESIGTDVEYAPYVELGHHQTPGRYVPAIKKRLKASWVNPKPFLRPAIENHRNEYKRILEVELNK